MIDAPSPIMFVVFSSGPGSLHNRWEPHSRSVAISSSSKISVGLATVEKLIKALIGSEVASRVFLSPSEGYAGDGGLQCNRERPSVFELEYRCLLLSK